jgi:hypothetical protein
VLRPEQVCGASVDERGQQQQSSTRILRVHAAMPGCAQQLVAAAATRHIMLRLASCCGWACKHHSHLLPRCCGKHPALQVIARRATAHLVPRGLAQADPQLAGLANAMPPEVYRLFVFNRVTAERERICPQCRTMYR